MKKTLVALLLVSTVMVMSMPGMADPRINITKTVDLIQTATSSATSTVGQTLDNSGAQSNSATVVALGGAAGALSSANASGMASNSGMAKIMEDDSGSANAGNAYSGSAVAASGASATGGDGTNGEVDQSNEVDQAAGAALVTIQTTVQNIQDFECFVPVVYVRGSIFDNTMGDDNLIEIGSSPDGYVDGQGSFCRPPEG